MSIASRECEVQYHIVFKPDGTVEGSGSSAEGNFKIDGAYNLRKGIVAWRQTAASCPVWFNPCSKYGAKIEAEFFGHMLNFSGPGPARIMGTFLTDLGRYCAVNVTCPGTNTTNTQSAAQEAFAEMEQLPTLLTSRLTGKWQPITKDKEDARRKKFIKQWTNNSDTVHSWEHVDEDEDDEEDEEQQQQGA